MVRESRETDEVLVCMAQRLQSQLERQLTLVERLQVHGGDETLADLAELRTSLQRSLRGSENVLVLAGAQQGPRTRGPRSVADVLADARAAVEDVTRVGLGPAPDASIAPRAVSGLVALFTELLTHAVTSAAPTSRVEVTSARSEDGGVGVEVVVDGPGLSPGELDELNRRLGDRPIIDDIVSNRVGLFVAARLARRCGVALRVQPRRGHLAAPGIVVVAHCPPDLLDAVAFIAPDAAPRNWSRDPAPRNGNGHTGTNGNGRTGNGYPGGGQPGNGRPGPANGARPGDARPAAGRRPAAPDAAPAAGPERVRRPDPLSDPLPGFAPRLRPEPFRPVGPDPALPVTDPVWPEPVHATDDPPTSPPPPVAGQDRTSSTDPPYGTAPLRFSSGPDASDDLWSGTRPDAPRAAGRPSGTYPAEGHRPAVAPLDGLSAAVRTGPSRADRDGGSGPTRRGDGHRSEPLWADEPRRPEDPFRPGGATRPVQPPVLPAEPLWSDEAPLSRGSGDAELFGPLTSTLRDRMRESGPNPIYEAVASAWFVDGEAGATERPAGAAPADWNTPSDAEWRAASERAARPAGPPEQSTSAGLPRRRPGTQMVAPPRHGAPAPQGGSREREPEKVRERLAVYQQGLERGRHRASDSDL